MHQFKFITVKQCSTAINKMLRLGHMIANTMIVNKTQNIEEGLCGNGQGCQKPRYQYLVFGLFL